ncbi:response regulator [Sphingomonas aliaeris]|uniref:Response regulator n=1 Tax=Sphingomonas aliaeris TaxID=2759526 RepID=A0A974NVE8_9SPHN|nr:response regulator [Sphingomonas aliaeris]QQV77580.1 response regulator [Sphingomonas aliaeris]
MCHVLIIEDEWLIAEYIECLARDAGATSATTVDCEDDAIAAAIDRRPEIILSDVNLRVGTGPRAVENILEALGAIPVIFITANPGDCVPCAPPGVILNKPIQPQMLIDAFKRYAVAG